MDSITNGELIKLLFKERTHESNPFSKDVYIETGEVTSDKLETAKIDYIKRIIVPSHKKAPNDQFEEVQESVVVERKFHDLDDVLLNKQLDNIRAEFGFVRFVV
jgi:hypothetical protein